MPEVTSLIGWSLLGPLLQVDLNFIGDTQALPKAVKNNAIPAWCIWASGVVHRFRSVAMS